MKVILVLIGLVVGIVAEKNLQLYDNYGVPLYNKIHSMWDGN